ncbi:MAG: phosphoribosyl-AMP cyclohydrolase [Sarcina sp.]
MENIDSEKLLMIVDFKKNFGLVPVIIINYINKDILMMAYMNKQSLEKTLSEKETYFYSRTRQTLWHKGETSGNTQEVKAIYLDCDNDTLLIEVKQKGVACHTGENSCFYKKINLN